MKKEKTLFQSNKITQTHLPFSKLELDLFIQILGLLKKDKFKYRFEFPTEQKREYVSAIKSLRDKYFIINNKNDKRITEVSILDAIDYPTNDELDNQYLMITLSHSIVPFLFNLKNQFTIFELKYFISLSSIYSKKLYTLMAQYKSIGHFQATLEELQYLFGVNYSAVGVFNNYVLKPAIDDIISNTNIKIINQLPVKSGRKITGFKFTFKFDNIQLEIPCLPTTMTSKDLDMYNRLISDYQLSNHQATVVMNSLSIKDVGKVLHAVQLRNDIKNVGGFVVDLLNRKHNLKL